MRQFKVLGVAMAAALLVAACGGGGGDGNQAPAIGYSGVVSFGDSLSDAGTYAVGPVKALGGGLFTVNGIAGSVGADPVPSYTWAQLISAAAVGKTSCAARMGGFGVAPTTVSGCTDYAQGGSRVTSPLGVGNPVGVGFTAGPLTEPVVTQVAHYLSDAGGSFSGKELVTVLAGANDLFGQTAKLTADATAAGNAAGATAFGQAVVGALAKDSASPAAAATAIGTAMAQAQVAAAQVPGATSTSILQAAVTGAVQAAAAQGNTNVLNLAYINTVMGAAQTAANTAFATSLVTQLIAGLAPANQATAAPAIGAAVQTAAAVPGASTTAIVTAAVTAAATDAATHSYANANIANAAAIGTAAGSTAVTAFVTSVVGALAPHTTTPATGATAIQTAMGAAIQAASAAPGATTTTILTAAGNAAVMAAASAGNTDVMGMTYINGIAAAAQASATTAGTAAGNAYAAGAGAQAAVGGMVTAANELVASVKGMVAKGATHIVVVNVPDVSQTPMAMAQDASSRALVLAMTTAFNQTLQAGLAGTQGVLFVDAFSENQRQLANPGHYALTNIKDMACDLSKSLVNPADPTTGSSLVCNPSKVIAGDISHYMFADTVHPTPYGHKLLAQYVSKALVTAGWL
jgi:phospholipase/lecithinase/hemolysin